MKAPIILILLGTWTTLFGLAPPEGELMPRIDHPVVYPGDLKSEQVYEIDAEHTFVTFKVQRFTMVKVVGFFPHVDGTIRFDADEPESVHADITIPTDQVYLGNSTGRDGAVKGPAFLHVEKYPVIRFVTVDVSENDHDFVAEADLTIHGVTRRVAFPFQIKGPFKDPTGLQTVAIEGSMSINRQEFGIAFDKKLPGGEPFIGNVVEIDINALAVASDS